MYTEKPFFVFVIVHTHDRQMHFTRHSIYVHIIINTYILSRRFASVSRVLQFAMFHLSAARSCSKSSSGGGDHGGSGSNVHMSWHMHMGATVTNMESHVQKTEQVHDSQRHACIHYLLHLTHGVFVVLMEMSPRLLLLPTPFQICVCVFYLHTCTHTYVCMHIHVHTCN